MVGRTLRHYRIVEFIGAGGMGEVYRAEDKRLGRDVALKVLPAKTLSDERARKRFRKEALALSKLNHPNVETIHDFDSEEGVDFLVMEYLPGPTLAERLTEGRLPHRDVASLGSQIAAGLQEAHEQGVVHRDLKPGNIKVSAKGQVKILDFGIARLLQPEGDTVSTESVTAEGSIPGTLAYVAPEVLRGMPADARSDVWSLGVVLYEMATGDRPYRQKTGFELSAAILSRRPPPPPVGVSAGLQNVIQRCLEKEPDRRYQRASEVQAALDALMSDVAAATTALMTPVRPGRRLWWVAAVALGLAVLLLGLLLRGRVKPGSPPLAGGGRLRLLYSAEGRSLEPSLSPDGKMIAYVEEDAGKVDLFVSRVAGGARVRLTDDAAVEGEPRFSPDGERIAFVCLPRGVARPEIHVIPSLGGDRVRVVEGARAPAWSPDGSRLAVVVDRPDEPDALVTVGLDETDPVRVLEGEALYPFLYAPSWSPDGALIAVVRSTGGIAGEIWLVPVEGGPPRRLSEDPQEVYSHSPVFAAGGRGIVHSSNRAGATNLWYQPLDAEPLVRLTTGAGPDVSPSVASDGSVAFANPRSRTGLLVLGLQTGASHEVLTHSYLIWAPAFSPDARELAFSRSETDGSWQVWIAPAAGGPSRRLTSGEEGALYPRFSPDGATIIFTTWRLPRRIGAVPRGGGPVVYLTPETEHCAWGDISPDGEWLAFARAESGSTRIHVQPMTGGPSRPLTASASTLPRWSPDGQWIAFCPDRGSSGGVFVVRPDGKAERRVSREGGWPVWWPDGSRIAYVVVGPDGNQLIRVASLEGGDTETLAGPPFVGTNYPFDLSAEGALLATSNVVQLTSDIWLLEPAP